VLGPHRQQVVGDARWIFLREYIHRLESFAWKPASFCGSSAIPMTIKSDETSLGAPLSWFGKRRRFVC
jgi:hypothetical protein